MPARLPAGTVAQIVLVMLLWAFCFPLISVALSLSPPLFLAGLRALVGGGALLLVALVVGSPRPKGRKSWGLLAGIGLTSTAVGFLGMFLAAEFIAPGYGTVAAASQPLMAAALASMFLGEQLGRRERIALALGFIGVLIIALPKLLPGSSPGATLGTIYVLIAALGVAVGNTLMKALSERVAPLAAMGWQLIIGGAPLLAIALASEQLPSDLSAPRFLWTLAALGIAGTALPFWLWFSILRTTALSHANAFSFLTPVFGLGIAIVLLGERPSAPELIGVALILMGMGRLAARS